MAFGGGRGGEPGTGAAGGVATTAAHVGTFGGAGGGAAGPASPGWQAGSPTEGVAERSRGEKRGAESAQGEPRWAGGGKRRGPESPGEGRQSGTKEAFRWWGSAVVDRRMTGGPGRLPRRRQSRRGGAKRSLAGAGSGEEGARGWYGRSQRGGGPFYERVTCLDSSCRPRKRGEGNAGRGHETTAGGGGEAHRGTRSGHGVVSGQP